MKRTYYCTAARIRTGSFTVKPAGMWATLEREASTCSVNHVGSGFFQTHYLDGRVSMFQISRCLSVQLLLNSPFIKQARLPNCSDQKCQWARSGPVDPERPTRDVLPCWHIPIKHWHREESCQESPWQEYHGHYGNGLHRCALFFCSQRPTCECPMRYLSSCGHRLA